ATTPSLHARKPARALRSGRTQPHPKNHAFAYIVLSRVPYRPSALTKRVVVQETKLVRVNEFRRSCHVLEMMAVSTPAFRTSIYAPPPAHPHDPTSKRSAARPRRTRGRSGSHRDAFYRGQRNHLGHCASGEKIGKALRRARADAPLAR